MTTARYPSSPTRTAARRLAAAAGLAAACCTAPALADGRAGLPADTPPAYLQECGSCHIAYPPAMLPATSWQRLMGGRDRHFGSDASLDAATTRRIADWLQANAATGSRRAEPPPQDRITRAAWFERKHRKVEPEVWSLPSVRSAAMCAACHRGADQGRFDDDALLEPAGLSARQRRAWRD
jgi:hypothetical protein